MRIRQAGKQLKFIWRLCLIKRYKNRICTETNHFWNTYLKASGGRRLAFSLFFPPTLSCCCQGGEKKRDLNLRSNEELIAPGTWKLLLLPIVPKSHTVCAELKLILLPICISYQMFSSRGGQSPWSWIKTPFFKPWDNKHQGSWRGTAGSIKALPGSSSRTSGMQGGDVQVTIYRHWGRHNSHCVR